MSVAWVSSNPSVNNNTTSTVSPTTSPGAIGPASGDLSGSYPNPTVDGLQGRPLASTAPTTNQVIIWNGTSWVPGTQPAAIPDPLSITELQTELITLDLGEYIENVVDGRVDFRPSGNASNHYGMYFDFTSFTAGVRVGIIQQSSGIKNPSGTYIQFENTLNLVNDKGFSLSSNDWYRFQTASQGFDTLQLGCATTTGTAAAFAIINQTGIGNANRSPIVQHVDPNLYIYSSDNAQANDYVRIWHDQTDANIEGGNGDLVLESRAGKVRIEGDAQIGGVTLSGQVAGRVMRSDGSGGLKFTRTFDPSTTAVAFTECTTTSFNDYQNVQAGSGASTVASSANDPRVGIALSDTGTTATGRAAVVTATTLNWTVGTSAIYFETALYLDDLSDGAQTFHIVAGLFDILTANSGDRIAFEYTDLTGSGAQWACITQVASPSGVTSTAVGSNVVLNQWYKLAIAINAAGTSVDFYIDGTLVATHTTNIPTGSTRRMGSGYNLRKTFGTGQVDLWCDYILTEQEVTR